MATTHLSPAFPRATTGWRRRLGRYFPQCAETQCQGRGRRLALPRWRNSGVYLQRNWYCSPQCLLPALEQALLPLLLHPETPPAPGRRLPIGLVLLNRGVIHAQQLRAALALQRERGEGRLGDWLRRLGAATEADITRALAIQWGCPVFPLERDSGYRQCAGLVPLNLSQTYGLLPVYRSRDRSLLYVAFRDGVDHALLYGIEQMLDCRTVPCIVNESAFAAALADLESRTSPRESIFDSVRGSFEIAHAACGFAERLGAQALRLARLGRTLWFRFLCRSGPRDLLFHLPAG